MMRWIVVSAVLTIGVNANTGYKTNNVCRDFRDYTNILTSRNCYHNPDAHASPSELAARYGNTLKTYKVTTEDGYILSIFRVCKNNTGHSDNRTPVILQHGILVDGVSWMISGEQSLAFILVNSGFDVWLPNYRGTQFSLNHVKPGITEKEYWNFSFHEVGVYDVPAIVELVGTVTNKTHNEIAYIGHSMGSTIGLVYASTKPDHANKYIAGMVHLAPVAFIQALRGVPRFAAILFVGLKEILDAIGIYSIGQLTQEQRLLLSRLCGRPPLIIACQIMYAAATGLVVDQVRPELFPVFFVNFPNACSTKTLNHYDQMFISKGRFQQYDYGRTINMEVYNSSVPPEYQVEKIAIPTHLICGEGDFIASKTDTQCLLNRLNCPKSIYSYNIAHNDFAYGKSVEPVYKHIVDTIRNLVVNRTRRKE